MIKIFLYLTFISLLYSYCIIYTSSLCVFSSKYIIMWIKTWKGTEQRFLDFLFLFHKMVIYVSTCTALPLLYSNNSYFSYLLSITDFKRHLHWHGYPVIQFEIKCKTLCLPFTTKQGSKSIVILIEQLLKYFG